ncbi:MAG: DUF7507 domain-containing protein [Acidimicrobiia bacterium]
MSKVSSSRRLRWPIIATLAALLSIASVAVGIAMSGSPDTIVLTLDGSNRQFEHNGATQQLSYGQNQCSVTPSSLSGPIMEVTGSTFDKKDKPVDPAPIGIVDNGIGVNEKGNGNGQDCGLVDNLDDDLSEKLVLSLGPAVEGRLIDHIDFDLEAKFDAVVRMDYFVGGEDGIPAGSDTWPLTVGGSDSGPDSGNRDNYMKTTVSDMDFDTVVITMDVGSVSIEGGADWSDGWTTVFYLEPGIPGIDIDVTTNLADGGYIPVGNDVTWTYAVSNTGNVPLANVDVTDSVLGDAPSYVSGDTNENDELDVTEVWLFEAYGLAIETAVGSPYTNTGSATAVYVESVGPAADGSSYVGSAPALSLGMSTNGTDDTPPFIATDADVNWTYRVTNTGNVPLTNVGVSDDLGGTVTCIPSSLNPGDSVDCTKTTTAQEGEQTNNGVANASGPSGGGDPAAAPASATYFGVSAGISIDSVTPNGEVIQTGSEFDRVFTVTNTGNVALSAVIATEGGATVCDDWEVDGTPVVPPGEIPANTTATCTVSQTAMEGEQSSVYVVTGQGPFGPVSSAPTQPAITYYGGFNCGEVTPEAGGPGPTLDAPHAIFVIGPDKDDNPCAVPVVVTSSTQGVGAEQEATVGPPAGWTWGGVTGVFTVEWDVEVPSPDSGIARTLQEVTVNNQSEEVVVPWCAEVVPVQQVAGEWFFELVPPETTYDQATPNGDACLIFQNTSEVNVGGTVYTKTTEAFYIWNDPKFVRR